MRGGRIRIVASGLDGAAHGLVVPMMSDTAGLLIIDHCCFLAVCFAAMIGPTLKVPQLTSDCVS